MDQQIEPVDITEEQLCVMFNEVCQNIEDMYERLETNPNELLRSTHLVRINDENEERTEFVRSDMERDDILFVRRELYRTYITKETAQELWVYFFKDDENEVTLTNYERLYVNDANQINDTETMFNQIRRYIYRFPNFYNNQRQIFDTLSRKLLLIHYNTLDYDKAFDEYYRETYDNY